MVILKYYRYHLKIKKHTIDSIKLDGKKVNTFKKPVTDKDVSKLYVVKHRSKIIYVGFTSQGIRNRLRYGLKAEGKRGYHGYQWKNLSNVNLLVWCFPGKTYKRIEAIEAELVYLIRKDTGQWPKCQTEIHFHNTSGNEIKEAKMIFEESRKKI